MPIESVVTVAEKSALVEGGTTALEGETVTTAAAPVATVVPLPSQPIAQAAAKAPMSPTAFARMCGTPVHLIYHERPPPGSEHWRIGSETRGECFGKEKCGAAKLKLRDPTSGHSPVRYSGSCVSSLPGF